MLRSLPALTVALLSGAALAMEGDPLKSPDCRGALDALHAQEAATAAVRGRQGDAARYEAARTTLETLRQRAAQLCLQGRADAPAPPRRFAQPPIAVPPVATPPASPRPPATVAPVVPRAVQIEPPVSVRGCDSLGCWTSDGQRLQRAGPKLLGPRGFCSLQGGLLLCP